VDSAGQGPIDAAIGCGADGGLGDNHSPVPMRLRWAMRGWDEGGATSRQAVLPPCTGLGKLLCGARSLMYPPTACMVGNQGPNQRRQVRCVYTASSTDGTRLRGQSALGRGSPLRLVQRSRPPTGVFLTLPNAGSPQNSLPLPTNQGQGSARSAQTVTRNPETCAQTSASASLCSRQPNAWRLS